MNVHLEEALFETLYNFLNSITSYIDSFHIKFTMNVHFLTYEIYTYGLLSPFISKTMHLAEAYK